MSIPVKIVKSMASDALRAFENGAPPENEKDTIGVAFIHPLRMAVRRRKGNEVSAAVLEVIDSLNLQNRSQQRPVISHRVKTELGWRMVLTLPPGISSHDLINKAAYFEEQTGGVIDWESKGRSLIMHIRTSDLPSMVAYSDWQIPEKMIAPIPIGVSAKGWICVDLADLPHMFDAGMTGTGKSNILHCDGISLLRAGVHVGIIDLKRLEFSYLRKHVTLATSIGLAKALLMALNKEMDRRLEVLEEHGCVNIKEFYRLRNDAKSVMPYYVLIIDELAELTDDTAQEALQRLLRLARAAGISIICATQRPSSTVYNKFGDAKANFAGTLCLRTRDAVNSRIVLDNDHAAKLPRIPGRAIWQWDQEIEVQTPYLPVSEAKKLAAKIIPVKEVLFASELCAARLQPR